MDSSVLNPESITTLGLASFPFARRYLENRCFFLFLRLLRCFSSAGIPPYGYVFTAQYLSIAQVGSPIRKSADQYLFTVPRSLSQLVTSFFGSWCQGIRPVLLLAWPFRSLVLSTIIWVLLWNCLPFRKNFYVFTLFSFQGTSCAFLQDTSISSIHW